MRMLIWWLWHHCLKIIIGSIGGGFGGRGGEGGFGGSGGAAGGFAGDSGGGASGSGYLFLMCHQLEQYICVTVISCVTFVLMSACVLPISVNTSLKQGFTAHIDWCVTFIP